MNKIIEKYKQLVSVKSSPYIRSNTSGIRPSEIKIKQNKLREDETQSEVNIDVSENGQSLLGRGNFKKKMTYENDEK